MTAENLSNVEIPFGRPWIEQEEKDAVLDVLNGHILTHGKSCEDFESSFKKFTGGGFAVSTSSCMASLHLSSLNLKLGKGDEVLVPALTHVATGHAIEIVGAKPVFIDCELETGNINIDDIESRITKNTKAISLVHFAGIPVEMEKVCKIAKKYNLGVIEDCALAIGSFYKNVHVGLWGDFGCFSFYPAKHITTGEGGMLLRSNAQKCEEVARFRAFNVDRSYANRVIPGIYDVTGVGLNYRMSEMQAALGNVQIKKLPEILKRRDTNFKFLKRKLLLIDNVSVLDSNNSDSINSHYCLVLILKGKLKYKRNELLIRMKKVGIGCSVYYPHPLPRLKHYKDKYNVSERNYKNASVISDCSIALPVGPHLNQGHMKIIYEELSSIINEFINE